MASPDGPTYHGPIFHIALAPEWEEARPGGSYERSTRGRSLDEVGFVHCSQRHQILPTAQRWYADEPEPLVVLVIDPAALPDVTAVELEPAPDGELFPHVYGPIPVAVVVDVAPLTRASDGTFHLDLP